MRLIFLFLFSYSALFSLDTLLHQEGVCFVGDNSNAVLNNSTYLTTIATSTACTTLDTWHIDYTGLIKYCDYDVNRVTWKYHVTQYTFSGSQSMAFDTNTHYLNQSTCTVDSVPSCVSPDIWDSNTSSCVTPVCGIPSGMVAITSLNESMCVGSFTDLQTDGTGQSYGELIWQACDSTCYGVKIKDLSCTDLETYNQRVCNGGSHNVITCNSSNGIGKINFDKSGCIPDVNPCDTLYDQVSSRCHQDGFHVVGYPECTHSGMTVTNNSIKCVENKPDPVVPSDCNEAFFEIYSWVTSTCECQQGYVRNNFGNCAIPLDTNATAQQIADKQNKDAQDELNKQKIASDSNATKNQQTADKTQNDTLTGIRKDLNSTNDLLSQIKDKNNSLDLSSTNDLLQLMNDKIDQSTDLSIDDITTQLEENANFVTQIKQQFTDFNTNVTTQLSNIETQFNETKALFTGTKTFTTLSGSTAGCFEYNFHDKVISYDLCTPFSIFAPIVYFVFTLSFMVINFRFLLNQLLKGFE